MKFIIDFIKLSSLVLCVSYITSCSYNISMSHTSGGSTDTMEDSASNTPDISPTVTIPMSAIPGV